MSFEAATNPHELHTYLEQIEQPVFLLADCRSKTEGQVVQRWLQGNVRGSGINLSTQFTTLDMSRDNAHGTAILSHRVRELPDNTLVIPLRVLWLPGEHHGRRLRDLILGNPHNPGWLMQKLILHFTPDRCSPVYGEPATLGQLREDMAANGNEQNLGRFIQRQAVLTMKQVERQLRGHRYKEPAFVENDILRDPEFCSDLKEIAARGGKSQQELQTEANSYIKELVPSSTPMGLDLLIRLSRFVYTRGYDKKIVCDPQQVEKLRELSREHPVILLCNHRSQVDSFAIYSALYDNDLPHPHTFGGINMKWPIIGNIQRSSGMIFIRRAFNDNPVYKAVLQRYIDYLVSRRFPLL